MQRILIIAGVLLLIIGLGWPLLRHLPLGRLPGDIVIEKENMTLYFPITTMILLSIVLSLISWIWRK